MILRYLTKEERASAASVAAVITECGFPCTEAGIITMPNGKVTTSSDFSAANLLRTVAVAYNEHDIAIFCTDSCNAFLLYETFSGDISGATSISKLPNSTIGSIAGYSDGKCIIYPASTGPGTYYKDLYYVTLPGYGMQKIIVDGQLYIYATGPAAVTTVCLKIDSVIEV